MKYKQTLLMGVVLLMGHQVLNAQNIEADSSKSVNPSDESVFEMSLEDLMNVEVTSVSKKAEKLQNVASSIYVLSKDDIMRSGATNFIELLRQVPGFWGTQEEYNTGSGTMRYSSVENGFIGSVLYLLDGTPIQELMSSTISFRNFDIPLDEIERIELIRGSGGTIYGANSATGVVNIFTKDPGKYENKLSVRAEAASYGFTNGTVRGGGKFGDKLGISAYGKFRHFNGYTPLNGFEGTNVTVPKNNGSGDTTIINRFDQNFQEQLTLSYGVKLSYELSEKTKISANTHFNNLYKKEYTNSFPAAYYGQRDVLYLNRVNTSRFTGNIRLDHNFSDKHSVFARLSSNRENDFFRLGGGYWAKNGIYDFEIQDNLSVGKNDLSFGANYRLVRFDIYDVNSSNSIEYVDPQANESLKGIFAQDKINILTDKLNLIVGAKAEQYTLVNNKFYLSPNVKITFTPTDKLTVWGGFTQSFTTPGFNMTNIDLNLFKAPSYNFFFSQEMPKVRSEVRSKAYQTAISNGADEATANAQAEAYINSAQGQSDVFAATDNQTKQLAAVYPKNYNIAVKNGSKTVPTKFQTFELGIRSSNINNTTIETNFFYTIISDGIAASPASMFKAQPSLTIPGEYADYYTYGNYLKGTSVGNESMIKSKPLSYLTIEGSMTWLKSKLEYQSNPDFDINAIADKDRSPAVPLMPQFIWRFKTYLDLPFDFGISASIIYATKSNTDAIYQYQNQRYTPILGGQGMIVATNTERTICNFRIEKKFDDKKLSVYIFGNDVFNNNGIIENTTNITNVTLAQIKSMYGLGVNYNF